MLLTAQIWDAQKQELAGRVGATSHRIASKVGEVLHAGKTATRRQGYRFKLGTKTSGWPLADVRYGSKADMCGAQQHVRFTPESDIKCDTGECRLWAKSGHLADLIFPVKNCSCEPRERSRDPSSPRGQEPDRAHQYQAHCPHDIEIEPAPGEELQTEPIMNEECNHAAGGHH